MAPTDARLSLLNSFEYYCMIAAIAANPSYPHCGTSKRYIPKVRFFGLAKTAVNDFQ